MKMCSTTPMTVSSLPTMERVSLSVAARLRRSTNTLVMAEQHSCGVRGGVAESQGVRQARNTERRGYKPHAVGCATKAGQAWIQIPAGTAGPKCIQPGRQGRVQAVAPAR